MDSRPFVELPTSDRASNNHQRRSLEKAINNLVFKISNGSACYIDMAIQFDLVGCAILTYNRGHQSILGDNMTKLGHIRGIVH